MTSTDLTPATPAGVPGLPQTSAVVQLSEWAAELNAAHALGRALADSSFLPRSLLVKSNNAPKTTEEIANDAATVILAGKSVGLDPMQSVQNIFPVHGTPSMYARTMNALVLAQGHETRRVSADDTQVTWAARRRGDTEWQEFTWTIERARRAGYTSNKKYESDPIAMLSAKALAEACRTMFADVLLGMPYSVEELELEDLGEKPAPAKPAPPAPKANTAAARLLSAPTPAPEPAAPLEEAPVDENTGELPAEAQDAPPRASETQIRTLVDAMNAAGHKTPRAKSAAIADKLGEAKAPHDLTPDDADLLIQLFEADAARATDG
jgi:hypothetical protein